MRICITILFFLFLQAAAEGQHRWILKVIPLDKDTSFIRDDYPFNRVHKSLPSALSEAGKILSSLWKDAFLMATIDSTRQADSSVTVFIHAGEKVRWLRLGRGNVDEGMLSQAGYREKIFSGKPFAYDEVARLFESILESAENGGYPFASVRLDSVRVIGNDISGSILLEKNGLVVIDSVVVYGDAQIAGYYLRNYLGIRHGDLYDESVIRKVSVRLSELPFLEEEKPFEVVFSGGNARVNLFLRQKKASRFNFIIGFLPNSAATVPAVKSKLVVTGEAQLNLRNPFGGGEKLDLSWKRLQASTQTLAASLDYPYLSFLPVPVGFDLRLKIYRRDTTFTERELGFGFQYQLSGTDYVRAFTGSKQASLLSVNEPLVISTRRLPPNIDYVHNSYGIEYYLERLDYRFNPLKGISLLLNGSLGEKRIIINDLITSLTDPNDLSYDYEHLYDSVALKSVQYKITYKLDRFWKAGGRTTVLTGLRGGVFFSGDIFENELYRLGGSSLLRGFDEESILASNYHMATVEFRLLLDRNSYVYLFCDGAYIAKPLGASVLTDHPFGFGSGISFETKAGIFGISYSLGRQLNNPVDFRSAKVHFGYMNYF